MSLFWFHRMNYLEIVFLIFSLCFRSLLDATNVTEVSRHVDSTSASVTVQNNLNVTETSIPPATSTLLQTSTEDSNTISVLSSTTGISEINNSAFNITTLNHTAGYTRTSNPVKSTSSQLNTTAGYTTSTAIELSPEKSTSDATSASSQLNNTAKYTTSTASDLSRVKSTSDAYIVSSSLKTSAEKSMESSVSQSANSATNSVIPGIDSTSDVERTVMPPDDTKSSKNERNGMKKEETISLAIGLSVGGSIIFAVIIGLIYCRYDRERKRRLVLAQHTRNRDREDDHGYDQTELQTRIDNSTMVNFSENESVTKYNVVKIRQNRKTSVVFQFIEVFRRNQDTAPFSTDMPDPSNEINFSNYAKNWFNTETGVAEVSSSNMLDRVESYSNENLVSSSSHQPAGSRFKRNSKYDKSAFGNDSDKVKSSKSKIRKEGNSEFTNKLPRTPV